ncbi:hypothetical protein M0802_005837 [Mischocyttarus mexicanus]|nr:hypothetical protein M0802_005837 [Mischocyttarus mexicanus]
MEEFLIPPPEYLYSLDLSLAERTAATIGNSRLLESLALSVVMKKDCYFYILDKLLVNVGLQWIFKDRNIKEHYNVTPSVGISFNNCQNVQNERLCSNKQFNCFVVNLKSSFNMPISEKSDSIFELNFPIQYSTDVTIFSFVNKRLVPKHSTNVINLNNQDASEGSAFLRPLKNFVKEKNSLSRILIIFCRMTCYQKLFRLITIISFWFSSYDMTIWFAMVDEITICRYNLGNHFCKINTEFLFMFINNPSYKAYIKHLFSNCDTANRIRTRLQNYKRKIKYSSGSIAFMHVSNGRMRKCYDLDTSIFREVFPEIRLFPFYGNRSFSCGFHIISAIRNSSLYSMWTTPLKRATNLLLLLRN